MPICSHLFLPQDDALELRCRGHGARDRAVLTDIRMQEFQTQAGFVRIDDELIVDRNHLRRAVLPDAVELYFHGPGSNLSMGVNRSMPLIMQAAMAARNSSAGLKPSDRPLTSVSRTVLAALVEARPQCESIRLAPTRYRASVSSQAASQRARSSGLGSPPACTTLPSTTIPGVDAMP